MPSRILLLAAAAATLSATACRQDEVISPSISEATGETSDPADVVATVELRHGGAISFLDLGDGHVGIAERAPEQARFVSVSMIESRKATPLEVYLAVRPAGADVPDRLVRDHERVAMSRSAAPAPRILAGPSAGESPLADPGFGSYPCEPTGAQWVADWKAAFVGITKYRAAAYLHAYASPYTFYPGAPVYYGTNTNSITFLGACNGDDRDDLVLEVHRKVSGLWRRVHMATIPGGEKYTFYSGIPARYRGYTYGADESTVEHYGVGAAWTLSPSEATP